MQQKEELKKSIKEGIYFKDALGWYAAKYIFPFTQRASFLVLCGIILVGALISINAARNSFESTKIPFPIYAKDQVKFFSIIKPLSKGEESIDISIARYFIGKYVTLRENYNHLDFSGENRGLTQNKIKALSSSQVYSSYQEYMDPNQNSDSPITKYKNQTTRLVKIKEILMQAPAGYPESAVVTFTATEKNNLNVTSQEYQAELSFMMNNMEKVYAESEPLYFIVSKYRTYKLSN
ncbi:MAG: putative type secretion system protein [Candidatus Midichloriaceae bacterium]|jgi:type IV secretory pathway component VirB8|nr:putative type secretion system protein [Candidatus Midichloriaceae bacterium]